MVPQQRLTSLSKVEFARQGGNGETRHDGRNRNERTDAALSMEVWNLNRADSEDQNIIMLIELISPSICLMLLGG